MPSYLGISILENEVLTLNDNDGSLRHVTTTNHLNFLPLISRKPIIKLGFNWPSSLREKDV